MPQSLCVLILQTKWAFTLLGPALLLVSTTAAPVQAAVPDQPQAAPPLSPGMFQHYVDEFNSRDEELYPQHISNAGAWSFLSTHMPLFECPDPIIERTYYFRWWTYRKHIKQTPDGFVITEFLPNVSWAGKHNTIDCAAGHHFNEGRWLRDPKYLDDYALFWFRKGGDPQRYSFWASDAIYSRYLVTGDKTEVLELLPDLLANYARWEKGWRDVNGLFWQNDGNDGMEVSIGGNGYRATINAYMYGDALAIANIAELAGQPDLASQFRQKASAIKQAVQTQLWDKDAQFFKVLPRRPGAKLVDVRELHGYTPWSCNLPDPEYAVAWTQLVDARGFAAPFGLTTAEQRHPRFAVSYQGHECQWNGPSWPYATSVTLSALANLLNNYQQNILGKSDYFACLKTYASSHQLRRDDGTVVPWIDENLDPYTGAWLARTRLEKWKHGTWDKDKGGRERGKDYNHSTFCDLVITGLVGLRPRADDVVEINPLVPEGLWQYFCLDRVLYHGRWLTILFDVTGQRYGKGAGLRVFADGQEIGAAAKLGRLLARLPTADVGQSAPQGSTSVETAAVWEKSTANPVLGGKLGTCFDISVLKERELFRMWFSWRPKASVALVESHDGVHWSDPVIVLSPNKATDWEGDINRPVVIKTADGYHMWYTGQAKGRSWIGYATSGDSQHWKRMSQRPVLSPEQSWENAAVMCPHVLCDAELGVYRMWYSGGEQYEPNAIGYATSSDGLHWTKHPDNPVFRPDKGSPWEQERVTACQVVRQGDWYLMFYIGFRDVDHAQIGVARSRDGITGWERHRANPIIRPGANKWDHDAVYKPYAILDGSRWLVWYNGRHGGVEQIGLATHAGADLGF
jgi:predicted GH43/DUF377 family glycosyl hydrolase